MASIPFSSFQFIFSFSFDFSFSFKVQVCSYSCLQFSGYGQVTGDKLQVERVGFICRMVSVDGSVQNRQRISEKFGSHPMDSAPRLRGSLLPHREDRIPNGASCQHYLFLLKVSAIIKLILRYIRDWVVFKFFPLSNL